MNTEGYVLSRVHLSPRILDPCILPLGTQRTTDASDLISTLYPQRCHLIIWKSLLWHFRYTFRRPFQHSTRLGNKICDSSSGFHGHGMWSILPSWSPQGMYHIGGSKFFSIIDRLIRQGSRNKISLCKWEKMPWSLYIAFVSAAIAMLFMCPSWQLWGSQWQKLAYVNWLSCSIHLLWWMLSCGQYCVTQKSPHFVPTSAYPSTLQTCLSLIFQFFVFQATARRQGDWPLTRIINILLLSRFPFHTKHITWYTAHSPIHWEEFFCPLFSLRIIPECGCNVANIHSWLAPSNSADPSINQFHTFLSSCSWSYRISHTLQVKARWRTLLVGDKWVYSWPLILQGLNPRCTHFHLTMVWLMFDPSNFMA